VDPQPSSANAPGEHDLSGWAIGERDFRNKFRIYYDKNYDRFSIQYNSGTEPVEIWNDYLSVRDVDGRVTVHGYGGLDATAGGFYTPLSRNLAVSATFSTPSLEWQWTHNLNAKPILWNTFNMEDKSITPISVDVSNPNIAYFYFTQPYAGRAIAGAEHLRGSGIRITDGSNNYLNSTILSFNSGHFYITHGLEGYPAINLQPNTSGVSSHSALTDLTADDHSQYLLTSAATSRALFATNWTDLTDGGETTLHSHAGGGGGFYGVYVRESDGHPPTFVNDTITFDSQYFYIVGAGAGNKPLVSLRPPPSGAAVHSGLTGLSADDHTQYILADGTRQFTGELQGRLKVAASITTAHSFYGDYGELAKHIYVGDHEVDAPVAGLGTGFGQPEHRTLITASAIGGVSDETIHLRLHSNSSASDHAAMIVGTKNASGDRTFATSPVEDDSVLIIQAGGYAGGSYEPSSRITFQIDTPITDVNYLPGRIVFSTQDGTGGAFAEAFRIDKSQIATFTKVAVGVTPTISTHLATKGYVDSAVVGPGAGPAFYGIYVGESDGNPPTYRNDTLIFDSQYFYLHSNSVSKPTVSMRDNFPKRFVQSFPIGAQEWQVNHNLGTTDIIFNVWDNRQISIIPDKADASNPNTAFFYFTTFRTGKACILGI
jgi:hypothetical protein